MKKRIRVGLIFGGKSAEHEVSVQSAKNVYKSLDPKKYSVTLIGISKAGKWYRYPKKHLLQSTFTNYSSVVENAKEMALNETMFDVVIPVMHGPYGEDGSMQGFLKIKNIPFVGPSVLGSAIGMDKDVSKRLLRDAGIPVLDFLVIRKNDEIRFDKITKIFGMPFFIKPANLGSSIGVAKVKTEKDFKSALNQVYDYGDKIIIEKFVKCREIECSVLGNDNPQISVPGEVIPTHEFYDYDAKYIDENGAILKIPAELSLKQKRIIKELALKTFKTLCLDGMARVDMFLADNGEIYVNEVNTIPGFTEISMYPKLWEASGLSYKDIIENLIDLAFKRFKKEQSFKTSF